MSQPRFKVGVDAITAVHEAQASYDAVAADVIAAKNTIQNKFEELREITGIYYKHIAPLKGYIKLVRPEPMNVDEWVKFSEEYNLNLF